MTYTLATTIEGPVDCTVGQIVASVLNCPQQDGWPERTEYTDDQLVEWAKAWIHWTDLFGFRTAGQVGRSNHETNHLRYTGDATFGSHNYAGLGTTGGGVAGNSFGSISEGVLAVCAHQGCYTWGPVENWPEHLRQYHNASGRYADVMRSGHAGKVKTWGDFTNGRWAWTRAIPVGSLDNNYARNSVEKANHVLAQSGGPPMPEMKPHIVLSAGHWNTAGGNADERETVRPLAFEIARQLRNTGRFDVTMMTPESGNYNGDHNDLARAVVALHATKPVALLLECHTEGTGNPANRGSFGVVPCWPKVNPTDKDVDAIAIAADLAVRIRDATGIPIKTTNVVQPGVMAEYQTGVGNDGFRLGLFANTAAAKATMTRMIFEYGAHTNPVDFAIQREPWFTERAARATVDAIGAFLGIPVSQPTPAPEPDPNAEYFPQTDKWIINQPDAPMLTTWRNKGGVAICGYPQTGMTLDADGVYRQYFDNVLLELYPDGLARFGGLGQRYMAALKRINELEAA